MVSINTAKCNTPRPNTRNESAVSPGCTRNARFFSNSFSNLSFKWREVTNLPSLPKKGELLMVKSILIVGSSISIGFIPSGFSKSATVSPISNPSMPSMAHISPAGTGVFTRTFSNPSNKYNSLMRDFCMRPSRFTSDIGMFSCRVPLCTRPMAIRPTYEE